MACIVGQERLFQTSYTQSTAVNRSLMNQSVVDVATADH